MAGKTLFLEGENGEQLNLKTISLIRDSMRLAWNNLAAQKCTPFTWRHTTASVHNFFHSYMEDKWPILRLCNNGWKLDKLASVTYPGYKWLYLNDKGHLKVKVKTEENTPVDDNGNLNHVGNENSNNENLTDKKNKPEKSKSDANIHTGQKRKSLNQPKPGIHLKRTKGIYLYLIPNADSIVFHIVSFTADEAMVPRLLDMETGGSKPSTEDSDTQQITDADNAPTLSNKDANESTSSWDFNLNPVDCYVWPR